ncbi:bifunctional diguanylate cyclase/phosphodiesterase [Nocardioides terrae]|nr:bifunctional diguanylate cyclase/phosphodiesterase [Nocardioides terrae]
MEAVQQPQVANPWPARLAYVALAVGLLIIAIFAGVQDTAANPWVYLVGAVYGTALTVTGAIRMPRSHRLAWVAFAVSQVFFLTGDVLWTIYDNVLDVSPSPSLADAGYLAQYPAFALGILWLVRTRRRGRDRAAFLDAAILTTGVTVAGLVFLILPAFAAADLTLGEQVVSAAYPVGDLLVLAVAFRLLADGMARNVSLQAMLASLVSLLVIDIAYGISVTLALDYPSWIDCGYLLSYLLIGFASLHPSARTLSQAAPDRAGGITAVRISWLGVALVLAPLTGLVADVSRFSDYPWIVFVGCCVAAVLVVARLWDLLKDLQRKAVQLAGLAGRDALTGVANRRRWDDELARACSFALENDSRLTVAVLDMDHFKEFNDSRGHLAGDVALKETAAAWASILGGRGLLARYGGEEFTVLLPQLEVAEASTVLDRLRLAVTHGQSCSIGVATWDGVEATAELMARADDALYRAKRSGRDRIAVHEEGSITVITPASYEAASLNAMRVVYQPIKDLRTGAVVGAEALSRFEGQNPRAVFDRAERDGTAAALEAAAIAKAISGWSGEGFLSVNVGLSSLASPAVQAALPDDLSSLVLEITEGEVLDFGAEIAQALDGARARGARIAIDDFGAGFSNMHRVARMRPDLVKIDMSLIRGIDADETLQAVVSGCLLYQNMTGTRVVAEGIETEEELRCLIDLGVVLGQGYLLGRPAPADSLDVLGSR